MKLYTAGNSLVGLRCLSSIRAHLLRARAVVDLLVLRDVCLLHKSDVPWILDLGQCFNR
jgi:hypothetical protein